MASAYTRKKQPELIRRTLLDCTARLAVEQGLGAVTVQAVADAAGVTKGGLFHHFPNKQALVAGVFTDLLDWFDAEINAAIAQDREPHGSFTRAYVAATFADRNLGRASPWAALSISMLTEPELRRLWSEWLKKRLDQHRDTDRGVALEVVRLAADGVWLAHLVQQTEGHELDFTDVRKHLVALTKRASVAHEGGTLGVSSLTLKA